MTFKQALELNANVRKGEQGSLVVYAYKITRTETDDGTGEETERDIPFMKGYTVFNVEQIEGLPAHFYPKPAPRSETVAAHRSGRRLSLPRPAPLSATAARRPITASAAIMCRCRPLRASGTRRVITPRLRMRCTHWTRHEKRLDRDFGRKRFGDEGYAMEELVAELGSAFLCADLELTPELRDDHASYIASWLKVLKSDQRAIFTAASHAQRAADFLHGLAAGKRAGDSSMSPRCMPQVAQLGFNSLLDEAEHANNARTLAKELAHLPGNMEEALPFFRALIERHHAAMLAGDEQEAMALREEADRLATKLNNYEPGIIAGDDAPRLCP